MFRKRTQSAPPTEQQRAKRHRGMGCSSTTSSLPGRGPSLWNTEEDEPEEVDEVDVVGHSSDSDIPLGQARAGSVSEEGEHVGEPHQFRGLIERAAQALGIETGVVPLTL